MTVESLSHWFHKVAELPAADGAAAPRDVLHRIEAALHPFLGLTLEAFAELLGKVKKPKAPPKETFDRNYTTPNGTKVVRFQKDDKNEWKLVGEVKDDGSVVPLAGGLQGQPKPPEAGEEKKEKSDDNKATDPKIT